MKILPHVSKIQNRRALYIPCTKAPLEMGGRILPHRTAARETCICLGDLRRVEHRIPDWLSALGSNGRTFYKKMHITLWRK